jgi:predicted ATPase/transcriptional regulator with XRE-family HTH domain
MIGCKYLNLPTAPTEFRAMPTSDPTSLSMLLRRFRLLAGLSQEELAERSGLSTRAISDLERGVSLAPRPDTIRMLAEGLGLVAAERASLIAAARPELTSDLKGNSTEATTQLGNLAAQLPASPAGLIGRESDVTDLASRVTQGAVRLVTLTGPGGVGKTRLALEVAHRVADVFEDGAYFIDLSPVRDPDQVAGSIARVLGVREYGDRPTSERLLAELGRKHRLLVLDNFEQIIEAAPLVSELLAAAPQVHILVTSREALRVRGEVVVAVRPFEPPSGQAGQGNPAIDLFVATAQSVKPDFALSPQNAPVVAEICRRLDGLPLAIELAATRVRHFSPELLLSRLGQRLPVLTGGSRDSPARHQTLRNTIAWSYDLLEPAEQLLFRSVGVFAGGASFEAVEAIALAASPSLDVMAGLASLIDKSLVIERENTDGTPRFAMLETLREFALAALAETHELEQARENHAHWFVSVAEAAYVSTERTGAVLGRIDLEYDNIAAAIEWALGHQISDLAVRLTGSLWFYWYGRGLYSQGRVWLEAALSLNGLVSNEATAGALATLGHLAHYQGDVRAAARAIEACLAISYTLDSPRMRGIALFFQGVALEDAGDFGEAEDRYTEARAEFRKTGDPTLVNGTISHTGITWLGRNEVEKAIACFETVRSEFDVINYSGLISTTHFYYGLAKCRLGQYSEAAAALAEALNVDAAIADREGMAMELAGISVLAAGIELFEESARLMGAAENQRTQIGLRPFALPEATDFQQAMDRARRALGEEIFEREWANGFSSSFEQRQGDIDRVLEAIWA